MELLRTPDEHFAGLPGYGFAPHYAELGEVRVHYVDEGARDAPVVLCLHGEPSWSYLYRKLVPPLVAAGLRVVAPDLVGFGRSDKPAAREVYTYQAHVDWMAALLDKLALRDVTLVCQDWGGLIGLRLVAEDERRFARVVASNTFLPTGDQPLPQAFFAWRAMSQTMPKLAIGRIVAGGCARPSAPEVIAAYDAPFPDERYKAGARQFPMLVPGSPDDPAAPANRAAWTVLERWEKPFVCAFGALDMITRGADRILIERIPGARGQPHTTLDDAAHFSQQDAGPRLAEVIVDLDRRLS